MTEKEYIERDKIGLTDFEIIMCKGNYKEALKILFNKIESIPAADVRPVVRGKWINYGDEYHPDIKCCMCGQRKPILLGNFNFNFCPNCGADMRG